mmetsp:Transcript_14380/g.56569  ORF Transcript_14380/g.56569 Transcript_14380/m.56569 type:complete len:1006 (+) Transcript_14380:134-3151(+)
MSFDLNLEDDIMDDGLPMPMPTDFTTRVADSCPAFLRGWLLKGSKGARTAKLIALAVTLVVALFVLLLIILAVTWMVMPSGDSNGSSMESSVNGTSPVEGSSAESSMLYPSDSVESSMEESSMDDDGAADLVWDDLRLPTWAAPEGYTITLRPNFDDFSFTGIMDVTVNVLEEGHDYIVMHSADLTITSITYSNGISLEYAFEEELQYVIIYFGEELSTGPWLISFEFNGMLRDDMAGFYRSSYTDDADGDQHWLASTQFEATDARRAFPCFDEPQLKATFQINLITENRPELVALSNMPVETFETIEGGEAIVYTFKESPLMSTYLVAFIIGEFASCPDCHAVLNGRDIAVWAPVGQEQFGVVALEAAMDCVAWYEGFFGIDYALEKIDMVAIPDFAAGAMENWGLITYRMTAILFDELNDSAANRQRVATVVAHELAHQWTGDYVTMAYWGNLWLNEGFADFFETESVNAVRPNWAMRDQFLFEDQQRAMAVDALSTTHPIVMDPHTENEISAMFDSITYSKGGSILRMLQAYLRSTSSTTDPFQDALHEYLDEYQYSNTVTDQLLASITQTTGVDVTTQFREWLYSPGFPLVQVSSVSGSGSVTVSQSRFYAGSDSKRSADSDATWFLPLEYLYGSASSQAPSHDTATVSDKSATVSLPAGSSWVKLNANQNGFYRVNYEDEQWALLSDLLSNGVFDQPADRVSLINDALVLARSGFLPTELAMDICCVLQTESEYTVWASGLGELNYIAQMLAGEAETYRSYNAFMQGLLANAYGEIGWGLGEVASGDADHQAALLRASILGHAITSGMEEAVTAALDLWQQVTTDSEFSIPADDRAAVYEAAMKYGTRDDYWTLLDMYMASSNAAEQKRILYALGSTRDYSLLQYTLQITLDDSIVRPQDQGTVIAGVASNPLGRDLAWDFYRSNFDAFNFRGFAVSNIVTYVTRNFNDELHLQEVQEFFASHPTNGADIAVQQSIETIESNIAWLAANSEALANYSWTC